MQTYYYASRGRLYVSGMTVLPLPLSVKQISDVVSVHAVLLNRQVLDECVFAIDDIWLKEQCK